MNSEELNTFLDSIKEKLGEETSALISDDLGNIITKNTEAINTLQNKDKEITRLSSLNEKLVSANGSLLQQVSMGVEQNTRVVKDDDPPKKSFNFRDAFDEKGRFKRKM
mgnify:CR=1 FL=1